MKLNDAILKVYKVKPKKNLTLFSGREAGYQFFNFFFRVFFMYFQSDFSVLAQVVKRYESW